MGVTRLVLSYRHLKPKLRVFLTGYVVAMVTRNVKKIGLGARQGHSSALHCASLLRINLRVISARTSVRTLRKWLLFLFGLARARGKSSFSRK